MIKYGNYNVYVGIDPSIANTGVSVIGAKNKKYYLLEKHNIVTQPTWTLDKKLYHIHIKLHAILKKLQLVTRFVGVEDCFMYRNVKTAMKLSMVQGVVRVILQSLKLHSNFITVFDIRKTICNKGNVGKDDIRAAILYKVRGVKDSFDSNVMDATAVALCYAMTDSSILDVNL